MVDTASDKLATNILLLDTHEVCSFADYFVICCGDSDRQMKAIYQEVRRALKQQGIIPHHDEGTIDSGWLLLDFGDVIVHIFSTSEREYYRLEQLWDQAGLVLSIQ